MGMVTEIHSQCLEEWWSLVTAVACMKTLEGPGAEDPETESQQKDSDEEKRQGLEEG